MKRIVDLLEVGIDAPKHRSDVYSYDRFNHFAKVLEH